MLNHSERKIITDKFWSKPERALAAAKQSAAGAPGEMTDREFQEFFGIGNWGAHQLIRETLNNEADVSEG